MNHRRTSKGTDNRADDDGAKNRGRRAAAKENGEVVGSGASAGAGGNPEDYDADVQGGQ